MNLEALQFHQHPPVMAHQVFAHSHRVSYAECTVGNHVYYARYLDIVEAARGEFFRTVGVPFLELQNAGFIFPAVECALNYRGAARYDDVIRIEIWLSELRRVRLTFQYRILDAQGRLLVEGSTVHACTNLSDKLLALPENLVERLTPYVAAE